MLKAELATVKNHLKEINLWLNSGPSESAILTDIHSRMFVIGLFTGKVSDMTFRRIY